MMSGSAPLLLACALLTGCAQFHEEVERERERRRSDPEAQRAAEERRRQTYEAWRPRPQTKCTSTVSGDTVYTTCD